MSAPQIPVLLSRQAIDSEGQLPAELTPPLEPMDVTWSMAQETRWVDHDTFAIGRWDGTLTLFGPPTAPGGGPRIESAAVSPAWAGLEMITPLRAGRFVTSNDAGSLVVWDLSAAGLASPSAILNYDPAIGAANSGALIDSHHPPLLVTGHASGWLLVWEADSEVRRFTLVRAIDVRSPDPVPSPYRLYNVRAVHAWHDVAVLTGGEDGDLCLVDVVAGHILCRHRYNPTAQRGINDVALLDGVALVGACSVGFADSNTWAFTLRRPANIEPLAHVDLTVEPGRAQTFNFSVELARAKGHVLFFCATEEGLLWGGELRGDVLAPLAQFRVSSGLGAAISIQPGGTILAVVGDNVHRFRVPDARHDL